MAAPQPGGSLPGPKRYQIDLFFTFSCIEKPAIPLKSTGIAAEVDDWEMIGVGVPIGQEVAGPKKRALFGHRSAHRARSGEGRFQPGNGLTRPHAHTAAVLNSLTSKHLVFPQPAEELGSRSAPSAMVRVLRGAHFHTSTCLGDSAQPALGIPSGIFSYVASPRGYGKR